MKTNFRIVISIILLMAVTLACGGTGAPTEDPNNAINTAVVGTQQASALAQATVNSTALTAMPATPTPGPTVEYVTLTEEEFVALIDEAVNEAVAATEQTTTAVTSEEVVYVYDYYYYADYYVEYAEDLLAEYYTLLDCCILDFLFR